MIGASLLLISAIIGFLVYFSPEFPDSVPSAETISIRDETYIEQSAFFQRLTRYLRDNHGGIVMAEEVDKKLAVAEGVGYSYLIFEHKYKFIDDELLIRLLRSFARTEQADYTIKKYSYKDKELNKPDSYEIIFTKENDPWISVKFSWVDETAYQKRKKIQYTEVTPESKIDLEEPTISSGDISRLVIVIDDIGNNMEVFRNLVELEYDITFSILPQLAFSLESAEIANQKGFDIMLHLPMQPKDWPKFNPGDGALLIGDDEETLYRKMEMNFASVPYIVGVNNHMGSAYTQYGEGLEVLMRVLKDRNLFFLDSKTAPGNIARSRARNNGVLYLSRNIFLDNVQEFSYVERQLNKAVNLAKRKGVAIAIGHAYSVTYEVLSRRLPDLKGEEIKITRISDLIGN